MAPIGGRWWRWPTRGRASRGSCGTPCSTAPGRRRRLGLAIVRQVVSAHGGEVMSGPVPAATFKISLPMPG